MRIKRIEISGFKSFCDRVVVNIDDPITAVVGPNGCGKSNIVDAIRWCMGEQSAKHLRGQAMGDVIFAGSESRGPAGMAEVSLTFDEVGFTHEQANLDLRQAAEDAAAEIDQQTGEAGGEAGAGTEGKAPAGNGPSAAPAAPADPEVAASGEQGPEASADEAAPASAGEIPTENLDAAQGPAQPKAEGEQSTEGEAKADGEQAAGSEAQPKGEGEQSAEGEGEGEAKAEGEGETKDPLLAEIDAMKPGEASAAADKVLSDQGPAFDFAQYNEVTITRRLFRDGTSAYMINKIPCRLRDVTEFFLGTGVGTKAYSIIEQGRIGMIVSSRPQDRRTLIEEAAGITKFKSKKRAAERKLDKTRQNLLRVNDIVEELGKRLGSLRRQAQKAERYRRYKTELKDIELWIASHRYLELAAQARVLTASLTQVRNDEETARADYDSKDAAVVAERADLSVEERRLAALQEQIYDLENKIKLSESKIEFQTREANELDERVAEAHGEIHALVERRSETDGELEAARTSYEAVEADAKREREGLETCQTALDEARRAQQEAQSLLDTARSEVSQARADAARAESQAQSLVRRRDDATARLTRLDEENQRSEERVRDLERTVKQADGVLGTLRQTRLDLGNQEQEIEGRLARTSEEADRFEAEVETLRTELHRRRSRLQSLEEIQSKYEGFARGTRAVMQRATDMSSTDDRIRGLVADVVAAPERLEVAVEAALGDRLGGILVDSHRLGVDAIGYLKEARAGRSAFVPTSALPTPSSGGGSAPVVEVSAAPVDAGFGSPALELLSEAPVAAPAPMIEFEDRTGAPGGEGVVGSMIDLVDLQPGYEHVGRRLLRDIYIVDSLQAAVRLHREGCEKTLVTLDGDIVDPGGVVSGGSPDVAGAGVLAQKREIRELGEIVEALEKDLADASARLVNAKAECQQLTKTLSKLRSDTHNRDIDILGHEKDMARSRGELDRLRERAAQLARERGELAESLEEMEREQKTAQELLLSATERSERFEKEQLGLIEQVTRAQIDVERLGGELTEARVRAASLAEKQSSLEQTLESLERTAAELAERAAALEEGIEVSTTRSKALRDEVESLSGAMGDLRENRRAQAEELEEGRREYERRISEMQVAENECRELRTTAEKLSKELNSLEMQSHDLGNERRHLQESMDERYRVRIDREVGDYHLRPMAGEEQLDRLAHLKKLIDRMGADINLTAIEEYEEISKRHEFLHTQQQDLESACDKLANAIQKINRTSRKLFQQTFDSVNAHFKAVYPRLFRGGRAELILRQQEGQDLLDSGIEIMAQPPGKKNSTVDQLSGGEKALTAVALIFSIFLIKPSPFCLLDEVDAPLDDVNVDRYNEIVREMTDRSQFIVITHNKRTMEIADQLYGITMQEPGVSKVVSVNLRAVDEFAA